MRSVGELEARFRDNGMRVTPQRRCVFEVLTGTTGHPTAEWVYDRARRQLPSISLRTVYQTLHDLEAMGELSPLHIAGGPTRFDVNATAHHHLVCERCGSVDDLDARLAQTQVADEVTDGFAVTSAEIVFHGRCRTCRQEGDAVPGASDHQPATNRPARASATDRSN